MSCDTVTVKIAYMVTGIYRLAFRWQIIFVEPDRFQMSLPP